jgi:hypothetical protein
VAGHPILAVWGRPKPPPKEKKKKKKKTEKWVCDFGGGRTIPKGLGVASATTYRSFGHPQNPKPIFPFFFFFPWWPFGLAGPPPKAWGGFGHPHMAGMGVWGGQSHPDFLFFFLNFLLFFKK